MRIIYSLTVGSAPVANLMCANLLPKWLNCIPKDVWYYYPNGTLSIPLLWKPNWCEMQPTDGSHTRISRRCYHNVWHIGRPGYDKIQWQYEQPDISQSGRQNFSCHSKWAFDSHVFQARLGKNQCNQISRVLWIQHNSQQM